MASRLGAGSVGGVVGVADALVDAAAVGGWEAVVLGRGADLRGVRVASRSAGSFAAGANGAGDAADGLGLRRRRGTAPRVTFWRCQGRD